MLSNRVRNYIYASLPKPAANYQNNHLDTPIRRILVLRNGPSPTFTYYIEERLKRALKPSDVRNLDARLDDIDPVGLFVVVCRYIRPRQLLWLTMNRKKLAGTSLLVDDDIAATVTGRGGSFSYKVYLACLGIAPLPFLNRLLSEIWVSTPRLGATLAEGNATAPIILPPFPPEETYTPLCVAPNLNKEIVAFHATGNHDDEHRFLLPIVRDALRLHPTLHFEVTASRRTVVKLWANSGLPLGRLHIKSSREWTKYLEETKTQPVSILLVPLLSNKINDARSATKRFDSARMAAATIFSCGHVYGQPEPGGEILVENTHEAWLNAILDLARDGDARLRATNATREKIASVRAETPNTLPISWTKLEMSGKPT